MHALVLEEEILCKQTYRITWLEEGDLNSSLFHKVANDGSRRKLNTVPKKDGSCLEDEGAIINKQGRTYFSNPRSNVRGSIFCYF